MRSKRVFPERVGSANFYKPLRISLFFVFCILFLCILFFFVLCVLLFSFPFPFHFLCLSCMVILCLIYTTIITINILYYFVCAYMCAHAHTHAHGKDSVNKAQKKGVSKKILLLFFTKIYPKCRIQCGPYATRLRLPEGRLCAALRRQYPCT